MTYNVFGETLNLAQSISFFFFFFSSSAMLLLQSSIALISSSTVIFFDHHAPTRLPKYFILYRRLAIFLLCLVDNKQYTIKSPAQITNVKEIKYKLEQKSKCGRRLPQV